VGDEQVGDVVVCFDLDRDDLQLSTALICTDP
jgi:hypothetical protein